jgi:hypothetical protein
LILTTVADQAVAELASLLFLEIGNAVSVTLVLFGKIAEDQCMPIL